jgi:hypothetical protein
MTTDDRELLELAALAAGVKVEGFCTAGAIIGGTVDVPEGTVDVLVYWNPLDDDGAALRLAVELRIDVLFTRTDVEAWASLHIVAAGETDPGAIIRLADGVCPHAATRRAIVRAAAEIGRRMKEAQG